MNYRPSPYIPFLRRFTDERALDLAETAALHNRVAAAYRSSIWSRPNALERFSNVIAEHVSSIVEVPNDLTIGTALDTFQRQLLALETEIFSFPDVDLAKPLTLKQQVNLNRQLRAQEYFLAHQEPIIEQLAIAIGNVAGGVIQSLPALPGGAFTVPLVTRLPDANDVVDRIIGTICTSELADVGLFAAIQDRIFENMYAYSGVPLDGSSKKPLITAKEAELSPEALVDTYLAGTPLRALLLTPVPFALTDEQRYEHTHVVGGSGHGKTQLLQHLILTDLQRAEPPALVIIDSQGEMLRKIQELDLFAPGRPLADKLISIDPEDVEHPPALNMFAIPGGRTARYSQSIKEQVEAGTIELFNYIFGAIAAELTSRQNTTFAYVTRLMLSMPGATIHTLRALFEDNAKSVDASPFGEHIRKLDATSQGYFENQFFSKAAAPTRQQIARRLYGVLQVPSFDRMFSAKENKLDMFEGMQSGKIVIVNTSKALLKTDASALFGRYVIARVIAAAFERVALPAKQRNPAFLIVDEAAEYFDDNLETLLSQARKFNVGVLFAHQHLDQLDTRGLRSAVAANTSIKLAGGVSDKDARALAPDMRTTPDFITGMTKRARYTEFACYVRNSTRNAMRLESPFGTLEAAPRMTEEAHTGLIAQNRARYAVLPDGSTPPPKQEPKVAAPPQQKKAAIVNPDSVATDPADEW